MAYLIKEKDGNFIITNLKEGNGLPEVYSQCSTLQESGKLCVQYDNGLRFGEYFFMTLFLLEIFFIGYLFGKTS